MQNFLIETLKVLSTLGFLAIFLYHYKKAMKIGNLANDYLIKNFRITEKYHRKVVTNIILKFLFFKPFYEKDIQNHLTELSKKEEFLNNQNK